MNIQSVTFHNQEIQVLNHDDKPYVAMKPIAENIGLAWNAQIERINRNEVLSSTTRMIRSVAEDGKTRELLCLPLGMLNGWLFGIEINRCKPEIRDILRLYQLECFDVLYKHFIPTEEHYTNECQEKTISASQAEIISKAVETLCRDKGISWQEVYPVLHTEFNVRSYTEILEKDFDRVLAMLNYKRPYSSYNAEDALRVNTVALAVHMIWVSVWFEEYESAIRKFNNRLGATLTDRFRDGRGVAKSLLKEYGMADKIPQIPRDFPWGGEYWEQDNSLKQLNLL